MAFKPLSRKQILHLCGENGGFECRTDNNAVNMNNMSTCMTLVNAGLLFIGSTEDDAYGKTVKWFHPTNAGMLEDVMDKVQYCLDNGKPLSKRDSYIKRAQEILESEPDLSSLLNTKVLKAIKEYK